MGRWALSLPKWIVCHISDAVNCETSHCQDDCKMTEAFRITYEALESIENCHGDDECGVCGSLRIAKETFRRIEELGK